MVFKPSHWLTTIDFIKRLIIQDQLILVVLSSPKTGKSTFIQLLSDKLSTTTKTIMLSAKASLATDCFVDIPEDERTLIVIDDAHFLSSDALLSLIQTYKEAVLKKELRLCLVAEPSFSSCLSGLTEAGLSDWIHTMILGPLTAAETKTYALHLSEKHQSWSLQQWAAFYETTQGAIDTIHRHLNASPLKSPAVLSSGHSKMFWIGLLGIVLIFTYFYSLKWLMVDSASPLTLSQQESYIPSRLLGAKYQRISPEPLNKYIQLSEVDEIPPVIDKVVVIPENAHG